jgi:hypothetical protein
VCQQLLQFLILLLLLPLFCNSNREPFILHSHSTAQHSIAWHFTGHTYIHTHTHTHKRSFNQAEGHLSYITPLYIVSSETSRESVSEGTGTGTGTGTEPRSATDRYTYTYTYTHTHTQTNKQTKETGQSLEK